MNQEILSEAVRISVKYQGQTVISTNEIDERLNFQMALYEARYGIEPVDSEKKKMLQAIKEFGFATASNGKRSTLDLAIHQVLSDICDRSFKGETIDKAQLSGFRKEVFEETQILDKQIE